MEALIAAFPPNGTEGGAAVTLVVSDNPDAPALTTATRHGIATVVHPFRPRKAFEAHVATQLAEHRIGLVCLAGFMRILSPAFTTRFAGQVLNIHPSLLPKYRGLHPQARALAAGETESGCTVHLVDAGVDTGRIVLQRAVPIKPGDTEETLSARILAVEHQLYPEAVRLVLEGMA